MSANRPTMPVIEQNREAMLYRAATMPRQAIDEQARTVELSFSSEEPADMGPWIGVEILGHDKSEVNMERLEQGTHPLLLQHDPKQQIGVIEKAWIDSESRKGKARVRFAPPTNRLAEEVYQDVLAGIRSLVSVGYSVEERKPIEDEDKEKLALSNKLKTKEVFRATAWTPMEISVVSVPMDFKQVGIGKEQKLEQTRQEPEKTTDKPPAEKPPEKELAQPQILTRKYMAEPDQKEKDRIELEEKQAREKAEAEARQREERLAFIKKQADDRVKEIYAIGSRFGCEKLKQQAIEEGWSVDKFRSVLLESMDEGKIIRQPDTESGNQEHKSIGELYVNSPMYRELAKRTGTRRNITVEVPRDTFKQYRQFSATTEGLTSIQKLPGVPGILDQQMLNVSALFPQSNTGSLTIRYIQEDAYQNYATGVAEAGAKPAATLNVSEVDATVRKIAVYVKVTDEMLADHEQMRGYIDGRLSYMVMAHEDENLLNGSAGGATNEITGIFEVTGINSIDCGSYNNNPLDTLGHALNQVRTNGFVEPDAMVVHPSDWTNMKLTKDSNQQYYGGGPFYAPYGAGGYSNVGFMWGLPVVITTHCTRGTALVGSFRIGAQIFRRKGLTIESTNSNDTDFQNNLITIRAETRLALACYKPLAFCEVTGIPIVP